MSEDMSRYLTRVWREHPILAQLSSLRSSSGEELRRALMELVANLPRMAGVSLSPVEEGTVQQVRGKGNLVSMRARPGYLLIERQAWEHPEQLWKELTHEVATFVTRSSGEAPHLGDSGLSGSVLLLLMIREGPEMMTRFGLHVPAQASSKTLIDRSSNS